MLIWNLGIILRIVIKVKINILLTSPLSVLVLPVPTALKKISKNANAFRDKSINNTTNNNIKIKKEAPVTAASV